MPDKNILLDRPADGVALLTLNRPDALNAMSRALMAELDETLSQCERDDSVRAIILTGSGEKAFSAGADIKEQARLQNDPSIPPVEQVYNPIYFHLATCAKPTIGALNGLAYGGGGIIAACVDIRVGCERTRFRFLGAAYGRVNSTWQLGAQVGWPVAKELLFTGRIVEAEEALRLGLLNHLVPSAQLMPKALELASLIAANDPRSVQGVKGLLTEQHGVSLREAYDLERQAVSGRLKPPPPSESFKGFLERKGT
jgi:2-(1,2-epoxy-1,2-dihydrophenyl)acetyl-CoA isomerase